MKKIPPCRVRDSFRPLQAPRFGGRKATRGFTLLEIVIVISLIGLILGLVATKIMGSDDNAKFRLTQAKLDTIAGKIDQYEADVGSLPDSLDQLATAPPNAQGWLGPYAKVEDLKDAWSQSIEYRKPGANGAPFSLVSLGADKAAGGEGVDQDIVKP
jgi:general secretion pathway protein G